MTLIHNFPLTSNGNDIVGGIIPTVSGVTFSNNGGYFNGSTYIRFTKSLGNTSFSLSVWLKFANVTSQMFAFGVGGSGGTAITGTSYTPNYGTSAYYTQVEVAINSSDFTAINYPSNLFVLSTYTYNSTTGLVSVYRGNTLITSGTRIASSINSNFGIGIPGMFGGWIFIGNILDARIYDNTLTANEIGSLVSAGPNGVSLGQRPQAIGGF